MKTIILAGVVCRCPFSSLLRPLTSDERAGLLESVRRHGVLAPVLLDEVGDVLDGQHRLEVASALGLPSVPTRALAGLTPEAKRQVALGANLNQRHLSPDEQQELRRQRIARVVEARGQRNPVSQAAHASLLKTKNPHTRQVEDRATSPYFVRMAFRSHSGGRGGGTAPAISRKGSMRFPISETNNQAPARLGLTACSWSRASSCLSSV